MLWRALRVLRAVRDVRWGAARREAHDGPPLRGFAPGDAAPLHDEAFYQRSLSVLELELEERAISVAGHEHATTRTNSPTIRSLGAR